ncbi:MAG: hypothetical protein ACRC7H_04635, partial [Plesiomonas shigelloides]
DLPFSTIINIMTLNMHAKCDGHWKRHAFIGVKKVKYHSFQWRFIESPDHNACSFAKGTRNMCR